MPSAALSTGIDVHYEWHGDDHEGTPVLFIRGTGADSSRWLPQVEEYKSRYRCLVFDNRGSGKSSAPPGDYTVAMMADDTTALLDHLDVEAAHISGLSLGGAIALDLAINHPERVATLQVHGSWARTEGYARMYLGLLVRLLEEGGLDLYYDGAFLYLFPPEYFITNYDQAMTILAGMKENSSPYDGLLGQLRANMSNDVLDRIGEITAPTLITVGELDMCLPPWYSRQIHHAISGSQLEVFPGGSHLFGLQDPATFNRVTLDWLDAQVAASTG